MTEQVDNDWRPTADLEMLRRRHGLLRLVRDFFDERGFLEVETPLLSRDSVVDRHIEPVALGPQQGWRDAGGHLAPELFLQTSPEFAMKRLLAAGSGPIYQVCKAFRLGEAGERHNPEFTMLEWYEPGLDYAAGRRQLAEFAQVVFAVESSDEIPFREAFASATGLDPFLASAPDLRAAVVSAGMSTGLADRLDRDALLDFLLAERVQPGLGLRRPCIVFDWPGSQAALAQVRSEGGCQVAERFELFVNGAELANGYHELTDAGELERRARCVNQLRQADGNRTLPERSRLIEALYSGMPSGCGVAMGLDRVLMVLTGAASIRNVIAFPADRA